MVRGKTRNLNTSGNNIDAKIHNRFAIEVVDAKTGKVKQKAEAYNTICNNLWNVLTVGSNYYFHYIRYGSGTGSPSATDTQLFHDDGYLSIETADDVYGNDANENWISITRKAILRENVSVGLTLTEVGISSGTAATTLCTHAMLQDMNGNPISIEKTDTDIINIYATVFVHVSGGNGVRLPPPTAMGMSGGLLNWLLGVSSRSSDSYFCFATGGSYDYSDTSLTFRNNRATGFFALFPATATYNSAAKTVTFTSARVPVESANIGGIGTVSLAQFRDIPSGVSDHTVCKRDVLIASVGSAWFQETEIVGEAIGTGDGSSVDFKTKFDRLTQAQILVNGVPASVQADLNKPAHLTNMGEYFELVEATGNKGTRLSPSPVKVSGFSASGVYPYGHATYYNPFYQIGIASVLVYYAKLEVSDDMQTWHNIADAQSGSRTITIPEEHKNRKYWRITATSTPSFSHLEDVTAEITDANNIHFASPPENGAVITANYTTKTVGKDENHVFDVSLTLHFGEYNA